MRTPLGSVGPVVPDGPKFRNFDYKEDSLDKQKYNREIKRIKIERLVKYDIIENH